MYWHSSFITLIPFHVPLLLECCRISLMLVKQARKCIQNWQLRVVVSRLNEAFKMTKSFPFIFIYSRLVFAFYTLYVFKAKSWYGPFFASKTHHMCPTSTKCQYRFVFAWYQYYDCIWIDIFCSANYNNSYINYLPSYRQISIYFSDDSVNDSSSQSLHCQWYS